MGTIELINLALAERVAELEAIDHDAIHRWYLKWHDWLVQIPADATAVELTGAPPELGCAGFGFFVPSWGESCSVISVRRLPEPQVAQIQRCGVDR